MIAFALSIPVLGLLGCLFIALRPHVMNDHVTKVQELWHSALMVEKIGLVFMVVPVPGPFDEIIGFVFLGVGRIQRKFRARKQRRADWLNQQFDEDTCSAHNVWCCDQCFDMSTAREVSVG